MRAPTMDNLLNNYYRYAPHFISYISPGFTLKLVVYHIFWLQDGKIRCVGIEPVNDNVGLVFDPGLALI